MSHGTVMKTCPYQPSTMTLWPYSLGGPSQHQLVQATSGTDRSDYLLFLLMNLNESAVNHHVPESVSQKGNRLLAQSLDEYVFEAWDTLVASEESK